MDAVILVYLITIFVVPIIMSLISCNIRNKSKKPTERKAHSYHKSSCESVEVFQLAANEKSPKQSRLISASIGESMASMKSNIDIGSSINSQKTKREIRTKPTVVKDAEKETSQIQAETLANSPAKKRGSSENGPGKEAQRSSTTPVIAAASLAKPTSSSAHSIDISASNKPQNPASSIKRLQLNPKQSDMIIPQYPASPVKIHS